MDATAQYMTGQMRPHHAALIAAFQQEGEAAVAQWRPALDVPYGVASRMTFDFFHAATPWRGTIAYFHAGYWQSRDKSQFRFLALAFLAHGIDVALVNYPLCPDVTLDALLAATRDSVPAILTHAKSLGRGGAGLVAAGHSAGAHIAVELALTDHARIAGVAALSGVFDLEPLLATPLNDRLRLDATSARALSPLHRVPPGLPPALFALGETETPAFHDQTARMHAAWLAAGNPATSFVQPHADHFTLLRALQHGALLDHVLALF